MSADAEEQLDLMELEFGPLSSVIPASGGGQSHGQQHFDSPPLPSASASLIEQHHHHQGLLMGVGVGRTRQRSDGEDKKLE